MIDPVVLRQVIASNRERVRRVKVFAREFDRSNYAQRVYIGVRQAGKSYGLFHKIQSLLASGTPIEDIVYVNFEDARLWNFETTDFERLLEAHSFLSHSGNPPMLFLDEVQNIEGWYKFARRMADEQACIYITGSNAKLLSQDIATTLGGRFISTIVFPFSFKERLDFKGISYDFAAQSSSEQRGKIVKEFFDHLSNGGIPRNLIEPDPDYLPSLFETIYLGDIIRRNNIALPRALFMVLKKIAESIGQPLSFTRLAHIVGSAGIAMAKTTVISYIDHAKDAFLVLAIPNFAAKLVEKETVPKYYFVDNGLIGLLNLDPLSAQFENIVALALLKHYGLKDRVFFWKKNIEVDFYVPQDELAIQVCRKLNADPQTRERKLKALVKLSQAAPCKRLLVLTEDDEKTVAMDGLTIEVMPVWKWLLNEI